jgi:hypothetical protein
MRSDLSENPARSESREPATRGAPRSSDALVGRARFLLASIIALHVALCVWVHAGRAWQEDELGSSLSLHQSYGELLTHFGTWQSMNFYLAGLKAIAGVVGDASWWLVIPGIAAGAWLVWLVARLALELGVGREGALVAALLVAVNPFLVSYSVTIRSYIFLAALSTAMMLALLAWRRSGAKRDAFLAAVFGALALLAHTNAVYTYAAVAVLAACWTVTDLRCDRAESLRRLLRLALPVATLSVLAAAAYWPQLPDMAQVRAKWSDTPPIPLTFLPALFSRYFGAGFLAVPALLAFLFAGWRVVRDRRESQWLLLAILAAIGSISLAGVSHFPWAYARFLIAILPWTVVLVAEGCARLALDSRKAAAVVVLLVAACSLLALASERERLHARPWHLVAQALHDDAAQGFGSIVLGDVAANAALRAYGVSGPTNAADVLSRLPAEESARLDVVLVPEEVAVTQPTRSFGSIRIFSVAGRPREIASALAQELIASAGDRVLGELAEIYKQIADLLRWIGSPGNAVKYDQLFVNSMGQRSRVQNLPPQILRSASASSDL